MALRPRSVPRPWSASRLLRPPGLLALACAACTGNALAPSSSTTPPAQIVAVPLTAASASIAKVGVTREELVPPWSLTASDGSGLVLTRVDAKAVFEGPLAFTELHLTFHNPEHRRREGTFQITLPAHAAVSRFAMETDGQWMEAEVVEKQLARRAYDDFLHRRQDPALLEKAPGNQFTAKVFPIDPDADKQLVISYSQELPGQRYVLPLRGLPRVEHVDVELLAAAPDGQHATERLARRDWQPDQDFVSAAPAGAAAVTSGTLVAAQVTMPAAIAGPAENPRGVTLLVDTSASRALGYPRYVHTVHDMIADLAARYGGALPVQVVAFDQDTQLVYAGPARGYGAAEDAKLVDRGAAGASDLGQALARLAGPVQPEPRVVVVTDGVITAGGDRAALEPAVKQLAARGVQRLDVVLAGGLRDAELAGALVHAGLPHAGVVLDADADRAGVAAALGEPVQVDVAVDVPGATWVYPRTIPSVLPGTTTMIYARLAAPAQTLDVSLGGLRQQLGLTTASAPLVERAVAGAEIAELEDRLATARADDAAALRAEIAKRSIAARVVSSQTAMLVLESDADYARYGIDRRALADVLVIGPRGLERRHREAPVEIAAPGPTAGPGNDHGATKARPAKLEKEPQDVTGGEASDGAAEGSAADLDKNGEADAPTVDLPATGDPAAAPADEVQEPPPPEPAPPATTPSRIEPIAVDHEANAPAGGGEGRAAAAEVGTEHAAPATVAAQAPAVYAEPRPLPAGSPAPLEQGEGDSGDPDRAPWPPKDKPAALTGELAAIEAALAAHDVDGALAKARDWHAQEPGDVRALIGLGDALEAKGSLGTAARVYGSIIDLFPGRADMRRFAGERLARVAAHGGPGDGLVIDTYRRAVADRPDHLTGHRLLAYALLRAGRPADAFAAILAGIDQPYPPGRYAGGDRVLADDAGMIGAAYATAEPAREKEIVAELSRRGLHLATRPSTRFILYWETDGNDVDFHIQDARGNHAWYGHKQLASGGELYADITTGYGPECFAIPGTPHAGPYRLSIDYYRQGPMGYGMGLVEIQRFDGHGHLSFEDRPYVIMNDHAYVDLGRYDQPTQ